MVRTRRNWIHPVPKVNYEYKKLRTALENCSILKIKLHLSSVTKKKEALNSRDKYSVSLYGFLRPTRPVRFISLVTSLLTILTQDRS